MRFNTLRYEKMNKIILVATSLLFAGSTCLNAQSSMVATGGELIGSGGSASSSVSQVNYQSVSGSNASSLGGVQQGERASVYKLIKSK